MSDDSKKKALDALVSDAKEDFVPRDVDIHWGRVEEKLMARIAEDEPPLLRDRRASGTGRARALRVTAIALAAAAAIAVVVRRDRDTSLVDAALPAATAEVQTASALRSSEGAGEVRISGTTATTGHVLRQGDVIEADRARGVFERARKVAWLIEQTEGEKSPARASVKSAAESLVLGLDDGAIEAQVTPVPSGEAFAVDVASNGKLVRVAVHGTHLRVTRHGRKVTVDLTEGVVSVGVPPRVGSTIGTIVTAPAHVELDVEDLERSLKVDHAPATMRAATPLAVTPAVAAHEPSPPAPRNDAPAGVVTKPTAIAHAPAKPEPPQAAPEPAGHVGRESPAAPARSMDGASLAPREEIAKAVRTCAAAKSRASEVKVTVTSTLKLKVAANGEVQTAQFDPPLTPDVQACAATAIYKTRFEQETGLVTVPIEFSY